MRFSRTSLSLFAVAASLLCIPSAGAKTASANLSVQMTADSQPVGPTDILQFEGLVANFGPDSARRVRNVFTIPDGYKFVPAASNRGCRAAGAKITCLTQVIAPGAEWFYYMNLRKIPSAPCRPSVAMTLQTSSAVADPDRTNNTASFAKDIRCAGAPAADGLSLTQKGLQVIDRKQQLDYQLTLVNQGPVRKDVHVSQPVPPGFSYDASHSSPECQLDFTDVHGKVICNYPSLGSGQTQKILLSWIPSDSFPCETGFSQRSTVYTGKDISAGQSTPPLMTVVHCSDQTTSASPLKLGMEVPPTVSAKSTVKVTYTVGNYTDDAYTGVVATLGLPIGMKYVSSDLAGCGIPSGGYDVRCSGFDLAPHEYRSFTVTYAFDGTPVCGRVYSFTMWAYAAQQGTNNALTEGPGTTATVQCL